MHNYKIVQGVVKDKPTRLAKQNATIFGVRDRGLSYSVIAYNKLGESAIKYLKKDTRILLSGNRLAKGLINCREINVIQA